MSTDTEKLAELRRAVRRAWMTGVPDYRRLYDKELYAVLGITHVHELYGKTEAVPANEAVDGYKMNGSTKAYCCYGMYCDVGHSANCKYAKAPA